MTEDFHAGDYITGGGVRGIFSREWPNSIVVWDQSGRDHGGHWDGKHRSIPKHLARRMTDDEIDRYLATPSRDDPDPQEIIKRGLEVQVTWNDEDHWQRRGAPNGRPAV